MGLFCIMFEIKRDIGRKSRFFHTHLAFGVPKRWNIAVPFAVEKLEWCGYTTVKKGGYKADTIAACDGRTDGRTNRRTDFFLQHSPHYAYASAGGKNRFVI